MDIKIPLYRVYQVGDKKVPAFVGHTLVELPESVEELMAITLDLAGKLDQSYGAVEKKSLLNFLLGIEAESLRGVIFAVYTALLTECQCEHHHWVVADEKGNQVEV